MGLIPTPEATRAASVTALPNNGGAPPPAVPVNPTPQQLANRTAAPAASMTPSLPPPSTATFSGPPQGTMKAPAVITSQVAEDHFGAMKTALERAQGDLQNLRTYKAQNAALPPNKPGENTPANTSGNPADAKPQNPSNTPEPNSLDSEISAILDSLGTKENAPAEPSKDQAATVENDQGAIADDQAAQQQVSDSLDSMSAGTYPLSPTEQAQVDSIKNQYTGALKAAQDYEKAKGLGATAAVAASGMEEYSPSEAIGDIHAAIQQGAAKIDTINTKVINAQAKLATTLQNNDYKTASRLYSQISSDIKLRSDEISKISTSLQKGTDTLQKNALATAKLQIQSILDTDKLDATQKQNLLNNTIKQGTLDEKTRHDAATELNAQMKAVKSSNSIKPDPKVVVTTEKWINDTRGKDGYADPNAYQQAFDAWVSEGHQAKDFVKNYPPKDFINPTNDWLPKYLSSKTTKASGTDVAAQIQAAFPSVSNFGAKPKSSWTGI